MKKWKSILNLTSPTRCLSSLSTLENKKDFKRSENMKITRKSKRVKKFSNLDRDLLKKKRSNLSMKKIHF